MDEVNANRTSTCRNTVQGKILLCDDAGFVCLRDDLLSNGCCPTKNERFICDSCETITSCCTKYEVCVSCCLRPQNKVFTRTCIYVVSDLKIFTHLGRTDIIRDEYYKLVRTTFWFNWRPVRALFV